MNLTRRQWLAAGLAPCVAAAQPARERPNLIVILADDLGYADVGFQGATDIPTPHLDRLASTGVRFTNAYVSHPFCSPTRAGLMTGRYQQRFGHENNPIYDPRDKIAGLPLEETTLARTLSAGGYRTGLIGKWHLGAHPRFHPMERGFQEMYGFLGGGHDYFKTEMEGDPREYFIPMQRNGAAEPLNGYLTDALSTEAESFIRRNATRPFFLYLAYNAPHTPQHVTEPYLDRVKSIADPVRRRYGAMIAAMDDGVGRVLKTLRDEKIEDDTLVVFLSDNGGPVTVNGSSNRPLRGAKGSVWEGGIRVPFVMRWPNGLRASNSPETRVLPAAPGSFVGASTAKAQTGPARPSDPRPSNGQTFSGLTCSIDLFPTLTAAAGVSTTPARRLDGVNLLPYLTREQKGSPHTTLFWRTGGGAAFAVRSDAYKLVKQGAQPPQLFDLEKDIGETRDIAGERADVLARLESLREKWNGELIAPLFQSPAARPSPRQ